jgi:two-component system, OmpR family, sensor histidine kinase SenX3
MVVAGRHKPVVFFIALAAALISVILLLYIGWVLLNWRTGILLFFGVILLALIISGVILNTTFLVREVRRNEQHDAFINAVTHELKTPVASIRLYLETLMTRSVEDKKRGEFYEAMLVDSERLISTIEQILRTGRIGLSTHLVNLAPIDLGELVEECVARARNLYNLKAESLQYLPGLRTEIQGDVDEVRAALSNIIDNAIKYSGNSVHVAVETAKVDGKYVTVRVEDQGIGIPKTELKRVFKRFYRIPGIASRRAKGTGLGLYIVRSVAKRHSGRAWAESDGPGHGSTFVLQFPIFK